MSQRITLEMFYDLESSYSYLAFTVLERYVPAVWPNVDLVLRPALLGGVFKAVGNVPPVTLTARAPYLLRDMGRQSEFIGVPVAIPQDFPKNGLVPMRMLAITPADKLRPLTRELYARHWGRGETIDTPEVLKEACTTVGVDPALVDKLSDPETKEALRKNTDEAVARGAFGFPTLFVGEEMFFGQDRLEVMAHQLALPWRGPRPA